MDKIWLFNVVNMLKLVILPESSQIFSGNNGEKINLNNNYSNICQNSCTFLELSLKISEKFDIFFISYWQIHKIWKIGNLRQFIFLFLSSAGLWSRRKL